MNLLSLFVVAAFVLSCGEQSSASPGVQPWNSQGEHSSKSTSTAAVADNMLIVPGQRVGEFVIGRGNATAIVNYKTRRAHDKYNRYFFGLDTQSASDLEFQLRPGGELDAVLVQSADYVTAEGFRVGTAVTDIEAALGEPRVRATERHGEVDVPLLDYGGIAFLVDKDRVTGIWVRS